MRVIVFLRMVHDMIFLFTRTFQLQLSKGVGLFWCWVMYMAFQPETEGFDFVVSSVLSSASLEPDDMLGSVGGYAAELL